MQLLGLLTVTLLLMPLAVSPLQDAVPQSGQPLFARITDMARQLSEQPYEAPNKDRLPRALLDLNYERYRDIRFNKSAALWRGLSLFNVELFHLGFLYKEPVVIHEVIDHVVNTVPYEPRLFDYGKNAGLEDALGPRLGFAGFRIHYPINRPDYADEVIAFLGASYFRLVGRGQSYGISARGIAIDTGLPEGEEFPRFREFWLVRPGAEATTMTFYALLDGESVVGAYRFDLTPGADTVLDVEARLFARKDIAKLGVAPLTSMFLYGENRTRFFDDFRPEVHDSDGLLMQTASGEWIWRPLANEDRLRVSSLLDQRLAGYGLVQRDRDFDNYLDLEARYDTRPSIWVTPRDEQWGKGLVQLIEIPSREETHDNIVAFWVDDRRLEAGDEATFRYRLRTFRDYPAGHELASVVRTRIGWGAIPGSGEKPPRSLRQFSVDFGGWELAGLDASQPVKAELSASAGRLRDLTTQRLPDGGWRVAFKLAPAEEKPADMRLFLTLRDRRVSETWNYVWQSPAEE